MTSPLFTPFHLKSLSLANRFIMPAMQRGMCEAGGEKFDPSTEALLKAAGVG